MRVRSVLLVLSALLVSQTSYAGRIFVSGHDPDFHAQSSSSAGLLLTTSLGWVQQGDPAPFLFLQTARTPIPAGHLDPFVTLTVSLGMVENVDFVRVDAAQFATEDLSLYSAIFVMSDFGGMLRRVDLDALIARTDDIIGYLNSGGGLVAWAESGSQSSDIGVNSPDLFGFLPFLVAGQTLNQSEQGFTVTPFGASLGITSAMVNGQFSHNIFTATGGMQVVDFDANGNIMSLAFDGPISREGVLLISLDPPLALNAPGQTHTATATIIDEAGVPEPGVAVSFSVTEGVNAGALGICSVNADCTTDASGNVSFTYTDAGGPGVDKIVASFVNAAGDPVSSNVALKFWDEDCNQNGIPDTCDIDCGGFADQCMEYVDCGLSTDSTGDGVPDECNRPPDCSLAGAEPAELWPPNHKFRGVSIAGVTDEDGDPVALTITGISQDEPTDSLGDGSSCPDGSGVATDTAFVRAERSGTPSLPGNGRVYEVSFSADDGSGGTCSGVVTVCVPHDQRRGHVCIDDGAVHDSTVCAP